MHVAFQLKVPIDLASKLRDRLAILLAAHEEEVKEFQKKIKTQPHSEKFFAENAKLIERKKHLTINHLVRAILMHGADALDKLKPADLLRLMDKDTVVRGRPRNGR
jgi:hypothetical protein